MARIALMVVVLYGLALVAVTVPVTTALMPNVDPADFFDLVREWPYWAWIGVALLGQAALLIVPVRVASRRPVTRRALFWPVAVTGFLVAGLFFGGALAIDELVEKSQVGNGTFAAPALAVGAAIWIFWIVFFRRVADRREARDRVTQQCRLLLVGSVLELLVAVPTHLVVRGRSYCCAGVFTFMSIAFGTAVMLFSFGPGVFFLFADRWTRLHSGSGSDDLRSSR